VDGSKTLKVYLDPKDKNSAEYKLDTFSGAHMRAAPRWRVWAC
jgi:small subunit ribosomal protein S7e